MDGFQKCLCPCALDESNFSIGRVNLLGTAIIDLSIVYDFRVLNRVVRRLATATAAGTISLTTRLATTL